MPSGKNTLKTLPNPSVKFQPKLSETYLHVIEEGNLSSFK